MRTQDLLATVERLRPLIEHNARQADAERQLSRDQQLTHFQLGKARARLEAARDTLHCAATAAYDDVAGSGALLTSESKVRIQLAACFAAEACAEAVRLVNDAVGSASFRTEHKFERHFRDAHVLLQHSDKSSARYASAGRLMLGLENDWVWLSF